MRFTLFSVSYRADPITLLIFLELDEMVILSYSNSIINVYGSIIADRALNEISFRSTVMFKYSGICRFAYLRIGNRLVGNHQHIECRDAIRTVAGQH